MGHLPYYVPRGKPTHSILKSRNKRSVLHHLDRTWQNTETYATDYSRTHATKTQAFSSLYPCVVISGRKRPCDCATIPVGTGCGNSSAQFQFSHYCHAIANSEKGSTHWQTVARHAVASKKKLNLTGCTMLHSFFLCQLQRLLDYLLADVQIRGQSEEPRKSTRQTLKKT